MRHIRLQLQRQLAPASFAHRHAARPSEPLCALHSQTIHEIYDILNDPKLPSPPDLELLINANDFSRALLKHQPVLPILSITKELGIGADILYPAGHYTAAGTMLGRIVSSIGRDAPIGWSDPHMFRSPWESKEKVVSARLRLKLAYIKGNVGTLRVKTSCQHQLACPMANPSKARQELGSPQNRSSK